MRNVARKAFLGFAAVLVILLILNTGANAITVSNVTNATPMATTVWILWNVSSEANNTVEYSVNPDLSNSLFSGWSNNTNTPMVKLWSLQPATTYYYRTWSFNTSNESDYINSPIYSFTTQECVSYRLVNVTDSSITRIDHPIQEAIDMICLDGGIVELNNGTFNISSPIRIRENNITFIGQGMGVTRIHVTTEDTDGIVIGRWDDWRQRHDDIYANDYLWKPYGEKFYQDHEEHPEHWCDNTTIKNFTIDGLFTSHYFSYVGIAGIQIWNTYISSVRIIGDSCSAAQLIDLCAAVSPTIENCELKDGGRGILFALGSGNFKAINNSFSHDTEYSALAVNGDLCCGNNLLKGNQFINGGGIIVYSSGDVTVTENIIENGYGNHGGIISMLSNDIIISKNIVKNSNYDKGAIRVSWAFYGGDVNISITNNLVYNNRDHGIFIDVDNQDTDRWANLSLILTSNTIVDSKKSGIFFGIDKDTSLADATLRSHLRIDSTIRNNIVVNNGEAGINSAQNIIVDEDGVKTVTGQDIEYNDVWNNSGGNYVDCDPGDNDISTDPLFADPDNSDFHLKSQAGRWNGTAWVKDDETSPCIDAGDPNSTYSNENYPHGQRINMGAYGNTSEASKSPYHKIYLSVPMTIYSNGEYSYPEPPITYKDNQTVNITFNMSDTTNLTINSYTSSQISFTATNTTTDQKMNITVFNGTFIVVNGKKYEIKKDGIVQQTKTASDNKVVFTDIPVGSDYVITEESGGKEHKLPVARPVVVTGIAILIVVAYWRYRRRRRRMRSGGLIVLVPGVAIEWSSFIYM